MWLDLSAVSPVSSPILSIVDAVVVVIVVVVVVAVVVVVVVDVVVVVVVVVDVVVVVVVVAVVRDPVDFRKPVSNSNLTNDMYLWLYTGLKCQFKLLLNAMGNHNRWRYHHRLLDHQIQ